MCVLYVLVDDVVCVVGCGDVMYDVGDGCDLVEFVWFGFFGFGVVL